MTAEKIEENTQAQIMSPRLLEKAERGLNLQLDEIEKEMDRVASAIQAKKELIESVRQNKL